MITKINISESADHDVRILSVQSPTSLPRQIPVYHVAGEKTFEVIVQNRGKNAETGSLDLVVNNTAIASATFNLANNEPTSLSLKADLASLAIGTNELHFRTDIPEDATPENNRLMIEKTVSDSTFVWDSADSDFSYGINLQQLMFGLGSIYELTRKDVLTSINVGFIPMETDMSGEQFALTVYPADDLTNLGAPYFTVQHLRIEGSSIAFDVPDTELDAGKYLFEVQQLSAKGFGLVCDKNPNGYCYLHNLNTGVVDYIGPDNGFGFLHIRPNFGVHPTGLTQVKADAQVQLYPNPASDWVTVAAAGQTIEQIRMYTLAGTTIYAVTEVNASEYRLNVSHLPQGVYFVTVQTNQGLGISRFMVK
jgi:hypothetical protein